MSSEKSAPAKPGALKLYALLACSTVAGIFSAEAVITILSEPAAIVEPGMADKPTENQPATENSRVVMN